MIAGQGEIDLLPLIGLVWTCAVLGDTTSFFIGRRLGRRFLEKHEPRVGITESRLAQVESYFERHGGKTILIGRFIGLVRALAPFVAGSSGVAYKRFIPFSIVGTGLWATVFCVLGYIFWRSFDRVAHLAGQAVFAFGVVAGVIVGVVVAFRRLRQPEERRKLAAWIDRQGEAGAAAAVRGRPPGVAPCRTAGLAGGGAASRVPLEPADAGRAGPGAHHLARGGRGPGSAPMSPPRLREPARKRPRPDAQGQAVVRHRREAARVRRGRRGGARVRPGRPAHAVTAVMVVVLVLISRSPADPARRRWWSDSA